VRVTLQLIRADDGTRIWSDDYDRQLTDIFAIQEDIARAVASSLSVPLGLQQGQRFVSSRTVDPETHDMYLRVRALYRGTQYREAEPLLDQLLARDSSYAPAWALRSYFYTFRTFFAPAMRNGSVEEARRAVAEWSDEQEMAARRAIEMDPNLPDGYVSLAVLEANRARPLAADELFLKALALDRDDPATLDLFANHLLGVGRLKEALAAVERVRLLEPFAPSFNADDPTHFWLNGQTSEAIAALNALPAPAAVARPRNLAQIYASEGRYGEAADELSGTAGGRYLPGQVEEAVRVLRMAPTAVDLPQSLPRLGDLSFVYWHVGVPDPFLDYLQERAEGGYTASVQTAALWHPTYAPVRKTERFKAYARAAGLVEYWRAKGWPDFCRPVGANDFVCE
jgi:tetratricopeptide (TPR) repeat protein